MFKCLARYKGTEEWIPVTFGGLPFMSDESNLLIMVGRMQAKYPEIEYKIVPE